MGIYSITYEDKSSTVIPRTPTLVPRFGVLAIYYVAPYVATT